MQQAAVALSKPQRNEVLIRTAADRPGYPGRRHAGEYFRCSSTMCGAWRPADASTELRAAKEADAALRIANEVASNPSPQLITMKGLFQRHAVATDIGAVLEAEGQALAEAYKTPEHHEAVSAFMEKRAPRFYPD